MEQAAHIFYRLTEVEKISIRGANPSRLEYLADHVHAVDLPQATFDERVTTFKEVQALCLLEFAAKSDNAGFDGTTWRF